MFPKFASHSVNRDAVKWSHYSGFERIVTLESAKYYDNPEFTGREIDGYVFVVDESGERYIVSVTGDHTVESLVKYYAERGFTDSHCCFAG